VMAVEAPIPSLNACIFGEGEEANYIDVPLIRSAQNSRFHLLLLWQVYCPLCFQLV